MRFEAGWNGRFAGVVVLAVTAMWAGGQSTGMKGGPPTTPPVFQTTPEIMSLDELVEQGTVLLDEARSGNGVAGITLAHYRGHSTVMTARTRSGGVEQLTHSSDFLLVISGEGTELTGGTIVDRTEAINGVIKGTRLEGATAHALHKGDILHIPSGTPHQAIEGPGQSIVVYIIKIDEPAPAMQEEP